MQTCDGIDFVAMIALILAGLTHGGKGTREAIKLGLDA